MLAHSTWVAPAAVEWPCGAIAARPKWRNGRRDGLKNRWAARLMWVRLPPSAPNLNLRRTKTWTRSARDRDRVLTPCRPFTDYAATYEPVRRFSRVTQRRFTARVGSNRSQTGEAQRLRTSQPKEPVAPYFSPESTKV